MTSSSIRSNINSSVDNQASSTKMAEGKKAKVLNDVQIRTLMISLQLKRHPERDQSIFLLSYRAGLRAKEIGCLTWGMVTDAEGHVADYISLPDMASKGKSGRQIPIQKQLKVALIALQEKTRAKQTIDPDDCIIVSERGDRMAENTIVAWFARLFKAHGYDGCSSHSGRRTFITQAARKASLVGASLRDVQQLAGHSSLHTTQGYIDGDSEAKRKLIDLL